MSDLIAPADHVFNVADWECTYDANDVFSLLTDDLEPGFVMEVGRLKRLPSVWAANVPTAWDETGEAEDFEVKLFATVAETKTAAKRKQP